MLMMLVALIMSIHGDIVLQNQTKQSSAPSLSPDYAQIFEVKLQTAMLLEWHKSFCSFGESPREDVGGKVLTSQMLKASRARSRSGCEECGHLNSAWSVNLVLFTVDDLTSNYCRFDHVAITIVVS